MGSSLEVNRNLTKREHSRIVKEKGPSSQENRNLKLQESSKVRKPIVLPQGDLKQARRQDVHDATLYQLKSTRNHHGQHGKGKAAKDDELVKYMSNLPGYLQRVDKGENLQEKALNVGVLDWTQLEKWKNKQSHVQTKVSKTTSSTSNKLPVNASGPFFPSAAYSKVPVHQDKINSSTGSNLSYQDDPSGKQSVGRAVPFRDFKSTSKTTLDEQKEVPRAHKSCSSKYPDRTSKKGKNSDLGESITSDMGMPLSNLRNGEISYNPKENVKCWDGEAEKNRNDIQDSVIKRKAKKLVPQSGSFSSTTDNCEFSSLENNRTAGNYETKRQDSDIDSGLQGRMGERKNIVLLYPRKLHHGCDAKGSQCFKTVNSGVQNLAAGTQNLAEEHQNNVSDVCTPKEVHSEDCSTNILYSCPLPTGFKTDMMPKGQEPLVEKCSSDALCSPPHSIKMPNVLQEDKLRENHRLDLRSTSAQAAENLKILDQGAAELASKKGRNSSPNRRFSFTLPRLSRSFSLKESSVPQLSSTYVSVKSGPVSFDASTDLNNSNANKSVAHNRARSSPLRRLLDPLLKSKGAIPPPSTESVQKLKGNSNYPGVGPTSASGSSKIGTDEASMIQALLQLTIKNGLPLFKFVVDNDSSILAATVRNSTDSGKDDSGQNYTFYSVKEIKKKSGSWITQGSKEKSCGYAYNVIGQMKASSSCSSDSRNKIIESALYGVEMRQADQDPNSVLSGELAAIVIRIPCDTFCNGQQGKIDKDLVSKVCTECLPGDRCFCDLRETEASDNIAVILPGGIHSVPDKGGPSSLINRWRSGGLCDCGGWDVGCKLRVLSNKKKCWKIQGTSNYCSLCDCFELYDQGGGQQIRPIFSLEPFQKGIYSVKFSASISLMQAFFICTAVLSSRKLSGLFEVTSRAEARQNQEMIFDENDKMKVFNIVPGEGPTKYVPNPPHSPVGRV